MQLRRTMTDTELTHAADLYGEEMPQPSEYLSVKQRDGGPLGADEIFEIVKQNCTTTFAGLPQVDKMEQLLRSRKNG